ncbi:MAG: replication factor C large subunit [Candidatus Aenigmarchaeota archaeon]|nr:replication factor C large subunit [Candidatus Aenigmarchaeota archaeon]
MLTEKHKPKTTADIVSQNAVVETLKNWFVNWKPGNKALFFYGPPGCGKTSVINAFAKEHRLELIEMNASDYRTPDQIQKVAGSASTQSSLTGRKKLILIDEVDGLSKEESVSPLVNLIKNSKFPIVMTANDAWDLKIRALHEVSELTPLRKIMYSSIARRLKEIATQEKIIVDDSLIKSIAENSAGDLRAAINDLESLSSSFRERKASIFDAVRNVFKSENAKDAKTSLNSVSEDPEYAFWWIENNVMEEYKDPEDLAKAMRALALADLFRTRIRKQNWKMLGYFIDMMTAGTAIAKKQKYSSFVMYRPPEIIASMSRTKKMRALRKEACKKIGKSLHESSSTVNSVYLPFLKIISQNKSVAERFGLTDEEAEILKT